MNAIEYPDFVLPSLHAASQGAPIFDNAVDDEHLCALVKDAHANAWATTRGSRRIAQPRSGIMPGVPMSDITFNYLFAELTRHVADDLIHANIDLAVSLDDGIAALSQARSPRDGQDGGTCSQTHPSWTTSPSTRSHVQ